MFTLATSKAFCDLSIMKQFLKFGEFTRQEIAIFPLPVQTSIRVIFLYFFASFKASLTITSVSFLGINTLLSTKKSKE
ncbi:MAG: hypothetical protein LBC61_07745 [Candidatus Peribacteria bacterium]|jgi:hypothetical protein|nr:hypothetical protein [Candidatus Peribacteria bacterium]